MDEEIRPEQVDEPQKESWYTSLTHNTPISRIFAAVLFVVLPFFGFWLGVEWGTNPDTQPYTNSTQVQEFDDLIKAIEHIPPDSSALVVQSQYVQDKRSVRIDSVDMPQPGFVVVSAGKSKGVSDLLPQGVSSNFFVKMQSDINHDGGAAHVYVDNGDGTYSSSDTYTRYSSDKRLSASFQLSVPLQTNMGVLSEYMQGGEQIGDCTLRTRLQDGRWESWFGGGDPSQGVVPVQLSSNLEAFMVQADTTIGMQKSLYVRSGNGVVIFGMQCIGRNSTMAEQRFDTVLSDL